MSIETPFNRRTFLKRGATVVGGVVALQGLSAIGASGSRVAAAPGDGAYGPLVPTPDLRDGVVRISLPQGFKYRSFGMAGSLMTDGNKTPLAHDGMAAFVMRSGRIRLVRNHEDRNAPGAGSTAGDPSKKYDPLGGAGCTTLVIDPKTRKLVRDFVSQNGTTVNCAGGATPWNSWITCEETNAGLPSGWTRQHGYAFDVPAGLNTTVQAVALTAMGRFAHEAVAVDPQSGIVYETEDNGTNSGFYRFIPNQYGRLAAGGKLQMLAIEGKPQYNTATGQTVGTKLPAIWVDIADPNPPGTSSTAVFNQGLALGGARFARLEGCWPGGAANSSIFFASTSGGAAGAGQVWEYNPRGNSGKGDLTLIFESPSAAVLDSPDNLTVSPKGGILLCEDGDGDQFLRGITSNGGIFDFAKNLQTEHEWAGATFAVSRGDDHDNRRDDEPGDKIVPGQQEDENDDEDRGKRRGRAEMTLFVNRQGSTSGANPPAPGNEGMTFAIWGPWDRGAL
jgi:uncharacterized protein